METNNFIQETVLSFIQEKCIMEYEESVECEQYFKSTYINKECDIEDVGQILF